MLLETERWCKSVYIKQVSMKSGFTV